MTSWTSKKSQKYFKKQQDYLAHVNGNVEETYSGQNIVKIFNGEEKVYTLNALEYELLTDVEEESFVIEVEDIKERNYLRKKVFY